MPVVDLYTLKVGSLKRVQRLRYLPRWGVVVLEGRQQRFWKEARKILDLIVGIPREGGGAEIVLVQYEELTSPSGLQ